MSMGEGWWLNARSGRDIPVHDHLFEVMDNPGEFHLSDRTVQPKPHESEADFRQRVLTAVMRKGWIRVRSHRGHTVFEYWRLNRRIADAIFDFIVETLGGGTGAMYQLNEVYSRRGFMVTGADFYQQIEAHLAGFESGGGNALYSMGYAMGQGR